MRAWTLNSWLNFVILLLYMHFVTFCIWCFGQIGDKELEEFLKEEIQMEKKQQTSSSGKLPKIKGFEITKTDGPNVTLSKKFENEM